MISGGLRAFEPEGDTLVMFGAGSLKLQPVPQGNTPSVMANALAQNLSRLEVSLKEMADDCNIKKPLNIVYKFLVENGQIEIAENLVNIHPEHSAQCPKMKLSDAYQNTLKT